MEALESIIWVALGFIPTMAFMEISLKIGRKRITKRKGKLSSMASSSSSSLPPMTKM
jgi:hypothetical protein